jgi:HEAT repeat protein
LDDPSPHVRSSAALVLAEVGDPDVLPDLLAMSQQRESTRWVLDGWQRLDGDPGMLRFGVGTWRRTDDAALEGLQLLSEPLGDDAWVRPPVDEDRIDASLRAAAEDAADWYREHVDALARLEPM